MSKVTPEIFNGDRRLLLSESFPCQLEKGITLKVPLANLSGRNEMSYVEIAINFSKEAAPEGVNDDADVRTSGLRVELTFYNISKWVYSWGLTAPTKMSIGDKSFELLFVVQPGAEDIKLFSVSIYEGE